MTRSTRPKTKLGLTIGDAAGIGPELILKAAVERPDQVADWVVFGSRAVLDWTVQRIPGLHAFSGKVIECSEQSPPSTLEPAKPSPFSARLQFAALKGAIQAAQDGSITAIVTAPWTKHILTLAGLTPTGHTEVLAKECNAEPTMMLCGEHLRVALATVHIPLKEVSQVLSSELIVGHLKTISSDLRRLFQIDSPRIAVCGLNPHAGEGGVLGAEDDEVIVPAVAAAREMGIDAIGPEPADALFGRVAHEKTADAVLAMYHDQGLTALKLWHYRRAANLTLGLPIIRTSVDHGTAYDIAGRGEADPSSLLFAIDLANQLVGGARVGSIHRR